MLPSLRHCHADEIFLDIPCAGQTKVLIQACAAVSIGEDSSGSPSRDSNPGPNTDQSIN